jgi:hypothetical protein
MAIAVESTLTFGGAEEARVEQWELTAAAVRRRLDQLAEELERERETPLPMAVLAHICQRLVETAFVLVAIGVLLIAMIVFLSGVVA